MCGVILSSDLSPVEMVFSPLHTFLIAHWPACELSCTQCWTVQHTPPAKLWQVPNTSRLLEKMIYWGWGQWEVVISLTLIPGNSNICLTRNGSGWERRKKIVWIGAGNSFWLYLTSLTLWSSVLPDLKNVTIANPYSFCCVQALFLVFYMNSFHLHTVFMG